MGHMKVPVDPRLHADRCWWWRRLLAICKENLPTVRPSKSCLKMHNRTIKIHTPDRSFPPFRHQQDIVAHMKQTYRHTCSIRRPSASGTGGWEGDSETILTSTILGKWKNVVLNCRSPRSVWIPLIENYCHNGLGLQPGQVCGSSLTPNWPSHW